MAPAATSDESAPLLSVTTSAAAAAGANANASASPHDPPQPRPRQATASQLSQSPRAASLLFPAEIHPTEPGCGSSLPYSELWVVSGTVIPRIAVSCIGFSVWGGVWTWLYLVVGVQEIAIPNTLISILAVVMGLLLVFRNNTAYDRYWESRKMWGILTTHTRNLARLATIAVRCSPTAPAEVAESLANEKQGMLNLLLAYVVSVKHHLRNENGHHYSDLYYLLLHIPEYAQGVQHPHVVSMPLEIAHHISSFIDRCKRSDWIDTTIHSSMQASTLQLIDALSSLERTSTSPIPIAYRAHLAHILALYLTFLPFQIVAQLGWMTVPVIFIASFTLLGIKAIADEIEGPMGYDANDLRVADFCSAIRDEMIQTRSRTPAITTSAVWTAAVPLDSIRGLAATAHMPSSRHLP